MPQSLEIDVDRLMEQVRATRGTGVLAAPQLETREEPASSQEATDLPVLHSHCDVYHVDFHSHRKVLGGVVVRLKHALRQLLTPILERQCVFNTASARVADSLQQQTSQLRRQLWQLQQQLAQLQLQDAQLHEHLDTMHQHHATAASTIRQELDALIQQQAIALEALRSEQAGQAQMFKQELEQRLGEQGAQLEQRLGEQGAQLEQRLGEQGAQMDGLERHYRQWGQALSRLKVDHVLQERRLTMLLEEARKRLPGPLDHSQLQVFAEEQSHILDALYASFEDQFRGTQQEIKERFKVYIPLMKRSRLGSADMPILDVGCGRGEWLELLGEEGFAAQGVDLNRLMIAGCRGRGLSVIEAEAVAYLATLPENSLGGVTGFHLIEHLPFEGLIKLLDETVRVLKPGGVAIFETPNPENVRVGSLSFYLDPTHRNPLPSSMVKFLAEARGLCRVEIMPLHPYPEAYRVEEKGLEVAERFNEYFYGPQDYAIVGWKV